MEYATVLEAIIKDTRDAVGRVAIAKAQQIDNITVNDDGTVEGDATANDIKQLLETYRSFMKKGADAHARRAIETLYKQDRSIKDLDLPDSILPKEIRADRFASAL